MVWFFRILQARLRMPAAVLSAVSVFALVIWLPGVSAAESPGTEPEPVYPTTATPYAAPLSGHALPDRSEQLEAIARQADRQIRHGFELAGRGAYFAARAEFITALRLVAQGLDTEEKTTAHGKALAAGLTALKEAEDFLPHGAKLEADLDLPVLIGGHGTPALKNRDMASLTPLTALKTYLTFAQRQLAVAAGRETAGAMALHALGKLHEALAEKKTTEIQAASAKAVAFYQAALTVCPQNFMTANELGVLLAKNGNYAEAQVWLEHSTALCRSETAWSNLVVVYERLNRPDLAERARHEVVLAQADKRSRLQSQSLAAGGAVRWVGAEAFGAPALAGRYDPASRGAKPVPAPQPSPRATASASNAQTGAEVFAPWNRAAPPEKEKHAEVWR
ncbi:MAG: tetratricopeptide repeat protein [Pirellulales bacterium]|nr:tetratricopeptide repeat protein [Pirellulales bacterium]